MERLVMSAIRNKHTEPRRRTVTAEVVGNSASGEQINPKWRAHFQRLLKLRNDLLREQRDEFNDAIEERPTYSMHMADAGTDSYDRDLALGLLSHEQDAVYEIEQALSRIRNGTYGVCELTGRKIPAARLEAIPWTRFTAQVERTLEKKGAIPRAQLGSRVTARPDRPTPEPEEER